MIMEIWIPSNASEAFIKSKVMYQIRYKMWYELNYHIIKSRKWVHSWKADIKRD